MENNLQRCKNSSILGSVGLSLTKYITLYVIFS